MSVANLLTSVFISLPRVSVRYLSASTRHNTVLDFPLFVNRSRVTSNGYYFFIFSSENEIEQNYVRATFNMKKVVYDVSDPVRQCNNQTGQCVLPLDFLSNEQVSGSGNGNWGDEPPIIKRPLTTWHLKLALALQTRAPLPLQFHVGR